MTEQGAAYLEPMRVVLGQGVLDAIKTAGWVLITAADFDTLQDAHVLRESR